MNRKAAKKPRSKWISLDTGNYPPTDEPVFLYSAYAKTWLVGFFSEFYFSDLKDWKDDMEWETEPDPQDHFHSCAFLGNDWVMEIDSWIDMYITHWRPMLYKTELPN